MSLPRPDLTLTAYAVSLGFKVRSYTAEHGSMDTPLFNGHGVPADPLTFVLQHPKGDDVVVWLTNRGWRVAQKRGEHYPLPQAKDFYQSLMLALDSAYAIRKESESDWRPATRVLNLPAKADLYRMSSDELAALLETLDAYQHEISEARREAIHRAGGKSEHKRTKPQDDAAEQQA